ncbi:MAG: sulfide-dependent adenosine diphosphate thiazole synthase [Euryarchaeota archaeon]|nr:sulfide-dependent adenosine diphosphate thiazole synthase [Euryarchaeota archaeon]
MAGLFAPVGEKEITRALVNRFNTVFDSIIDADVVIVGAGPSGIIAAGELAKNGVNVVCVESNNYLGGGFWVGGFMMNPLTVRAPAQKVLDELGCHYTGADGTEGLFLTTGPEACSKAIAWACDQGAVFQNVTNMEDIVLRNGEDGNPRVAGAVINWSPVASLPRQITCLDPVAIECKILIDATGHDADALSKLADMGLAELPGHGSMWIERSEDLVVENTGFVYPGLMVCGMAVTTAYGLPRMGPTFGAMLLSGKKAARIALEDLKRQGWTPREDGPANRRRREIEENVASGVGTTGTRRENADEEILLTA